MGRTDSLLALGAFLVLLTSCEGAPGTNASGDYPPVSLTADSGIVGTPFTAKIVYKSRWIESPQYGCLSKLPPGLHFDEASGEIRGTPTQVGTWEVFAGVRDRIKGTHEIPVEQDPDTVMTGNPKYHKVNPKPGHAVFYAGRFILTVTDHPLKAGEQPFHDEIKNRAREELLQYGPWDESRPMIGRIHYRPTDYDDPAATYSIPHYGINVTLPPHYVWRISDFQFKWGGEVIAEMASPDGAVTGVLWHAKWGLAPDKWAEGNEKYGRENAWKKRFEPMREEKSSTGLIREYEALNGTEPTLSHFVIAYSQQGMDNVMLCLGTIDSHWGGQREEIYKIVRHLEFRGPPPPAFTGIFSLQALIDFDSLDGAAVEPKTGTVSLFGHRARADRLAPIAYLDHLATAMECESPMFDLRWAPGSEAQVEDALAISEDKLIDQLGGFFDGNGHLTALGAWWYGKGGAQATVGMTRYQANAAALRATGRKDEATALLTLEKREEAMNKGKADEDQAYFELFCKLLGIDTVIAAQAQKYRAGQISEEQLLDATLPIYLGAVARLFGQDASPYQDQYSSLRRAGVGPVPASERTAAVILSPENQKAWLERVFFRDLFKNLGDIHVPPEFCSRILSVAPRVAPTFDHLPSRSLLARVAFEADLFGKRLMVMPELKNDISKYRTYFEWRRTIPQAPQDKEGHLWFSPDHFEIKESADGNAVSFGRTAVRINLRRKEGGRSVEDPVLRQYADELTSLYDDFARISPPLYELRECMKVVAIAGWLKKKGVHLKFPADGRCYWNPPKEAPGIVEIVFTTRGGPVGLMLWALGGVDFDGRYANGGTPAWNFRASTDPVAVGKMTVPLLQETNTTLAKYKLDTIDVPTPWIYGECPAEGGQKALKFVTLKEKELSSRGDAAEALLQLEKVRRKAEMLVRYDRMLNALTKERVAAKGDLEELKEEAERTMKDFMKDSKELIQSTAESTDEIESILRREKKESTPSGELLETLGKWKTLATDLKTAYQSTKSGEQGEEYFERLKDRVIELGREVGKQIKEREGTDPEIANFLVTRGALRLSIVYGLSSLTIKTSEIAYLHKMVSDVNDALGDRAKEAASLQKAREKVQKDYEAERRKLEEMLK